MATDKTEATKEHASTTPNANYSHILKYTGLFGSVQGLNILIALVRNKIVAVLLGPDGMGFMSLLNSITKFMSDSTNLGLSMSAVKRISEAYEQGNHTLVLRNVRLIRMWSLLTAVCGMLLCGILSPWLSTFASGSREYTIAILCISPIVALTALTGGETAILKGVRQLRPLAVISVSCLIAALVLSVPLFYLWGHAAIVPSLLLVSIGQTAITLRHSLKIFPLHTFRQGGVRLSEGYGMLWLGIAFVVAGIMGSGAEFLIRAYLNQNASLETVGLYNAGFVMTITYGSLIFSAMETDFFPRLSAVCSDTAQATLTVNRQIEVSVLLIAPMLVAFIIGLPILLPLLYSGKFLPVIGMMQITILALYLRAVKLPVAYLPLAHGDSKSYVLLEGIYSVILVALSIYGYSHWGGLQGLGTSILLTALTDFIILICYAHWKYRYRISASALRYLLYQMPVGIAAYFMAQYAKGLSYWISGILLAMCSTGISILILHSKTNLWKKLKLKFRKQE